MANVRIDLTADDLFGNDAADDEDEKLFQSYVLRRDEIGKFADASIRFRIVRAYKGEGKSALIRLAESSIVDADGEPIVIRTSGSALSPDIHSTDTDRLVREWKKNIFKTIAMHVGKRIGWAWRGSEVALVEEAEREYFKDTSLITTLTDRLKSSFVPLDRSTVPVTNTENIIRRWSKGKSPIWILVDDVDQDFKNTPEFRAKLSSFFTACRQVISTVPEIRIRSAIRPNIWTIVSRIEESMSKVDQYVFDLSWPEDAMRSLLARRVEAYIDRTGQAASVRLYSRTQSLVDKHYIGYVFEPSMRWGNEDRPPHVILHTLSRHRPRWMIDLAKRATARAASAHREMVTLADITDELYDFGQRRISDLLAEYSIQCDKLEDVIAAFSHKPNKYRTNELLRVLNDRILSTTPVKIEGTLGKPRAQDLGAFLFQIGFLSARRDMANGKYEHYTFSDKPSLLRTGSNLDDGVTWEIHPVFRKALNLV